MGEPGLEEKVEAKAKRTRRHNRKKTKLNHRIAARNNVPLLAHDSFAPALTVEVMSSDSSEEDEEGKRSFHLRGFSWRSQRAYNFYQAVDEEEHVGRDKNLKSTGQARQRRYGPPKNGDPLPPQGTPLWMVSKRWLRAQHHDKIAGLHLQDDRLDFRSYPDLGESSADEEIPMNGDGDMHMGDVSADVADVGI